MRQIFLDTETTGLSPESGDRIVEIGCVEMLNRRLSGRELHRYINPERPSSEEALKVHGLTDQFLSAQPTFAAIADELLDFCADAEIVIHNAAFDLGFLNEEFKRLGRAPFAENVASVCDSLAMARELFPGKSNSLDALCRRFEVDNSNRTLHGALLDAGLLAEVYLRMTRGQESLVIDIEGLGGGAAEVVRIDLSTLLLPVIAPSDDELVAHGALLAELDKASGGRALWRAVPMA